MVGNMSYALQHDGREHVLCVLRTFATRLWGSLQQALPAPCWAHLQPVATLETTVLEP